MGARMRPAPPDGLTGIDVRCLLIGMVRCWGDVWARNPLIGFGWERRRGLLRRRGGRRLIWE